jgi:hypothetical protein
VGEFENRLSDTEGVRVWMTGDCFPRKAKKDFSLLHRIQTGSGAHPTSFPRGLSSRVVKPRIKHVKI